MSDIDEQIKRRNKQLKIAIWLLLICTLTLTLYIALNLNKLAEESGHLVKIYQQAER